MFERLKSAGVEVDLVTSKGGKLNVAGAGHPEAINKAVPFFKKHLKVKLQGDAPNQALSDIIRRQEPT